MRRLAYFLGALAMLGCGTKNPVSADAGIPAFRGLTASPRQLPFTCVVPGCETDQTVRIISTVNRRVAIKRIVLSGENSEFTVTSEQQAPFILGAASEFNITVHFAPDGAGHPDSLNLLVTYTDASAEESPDRIEAGEVSVPLVKRLVGEPLMEANPGAISFGVVTIGETRDLPVSVVNAGFGNIALAVDRADAGRQADLSVTLPTGVALTPDASVDVPFVFKPTVEAYVKTEVEIGSSTPGVEPVYVTVEATSHSWPRVALEPEETALEFGEIVKGGMAHATVRLANVGGRELEISSLSADDPSGRVTVTFPDGMTTATLMPLERLPIDVTIHGSTPGDIEVPLKVVSNDPTRGMLEIPIRAVITEPKIETTPASLDWGTTPMGWVVSKGVELKNVGYGTLTVKRITFTGGTSNLFTLQNLPPVPFTLEREARSAFDVQFRAETAASFSGMVSIETDDPNDPFVTVALSASGGSCSAGCPIAHGTPSCAAGACSIGMCDTGWHDTDSEASNGCECQEPNTDPGGFCSQGVNKGTLHDDGSSTNQTGIIDSATDEDYIIFYGQDDTDYFFSDNFDVRINLTSSDPGITMCVSRYDTSTSVNECYPDSNKECGIRSYRRDGSWGSEDGAMFYIKVYRTAGSAPTCLQYTVNMTNG